MSMNTKQAAAAAKSGYSTKELVLDAMFIALTYVFTAFVNVRLPIAANGGLIHLGNVPLFICAILLGKRTFWGHNSGISILNCQSQDAQKLTLIKGYRKLRRKPVPFCNGEAVSGKLQPWIVM